MREPADEDAGERTSRRHGRTPGAAGSDAAGPPGAAGERGRDRPSGRHSAGHAVFTPGYTRAGADDEPGRAATADRPSDPGRGASSSRRHPPSAGSAAARGPVRGYPPTPDQPPPVYPPGQFAAWNRRGGGQPGRAGQPTGTGPSSGQQAQPGRTGGTGRYYADDADSVAEPGYPMLAVSDPAADVTSTQTWRAIEEGRSTGIWTAPPGLRDASPAIAAPGAAPPGRPDPAQPRPTRRHAAGPGRSPGAEPGTDVGASPRPNSGPVGSPRPNSGPFGSPRPNSGPFGSPGPGTGPNRAVGAAASQPATGAGQPATGGRRRPGSRAGRPRRRRSLSVILAMTAAGLLVVGAATTLVYTVLHTSPKPRLTGQASGKPSPSGSPSPGLGPYGDIASRQTDPQPLSLTELFPPSFSAIGVTMTSVASSLGGDCAAAIVGAKLQSAAGAADCTQVARATYVDLPGSLMGTVGVLNLSSGDAAKTAAQSADANDFISQLPAPSGPAQKIGQGTGIEEALAKGHYLILVWAEFTNLGTPTAQNTPLIEQFISVLVTNTVNKDLTTRMLTGSP